MRVPTAGCSISALEIIKKAGIKVHAHNMFELPLNSSNYVACWCSLNFVSQLPFWGPTAVTYFGYEKPPVIQKASLEIDYSFTSVLVRNMYLQCVSWLPWLTVL